MKKTRSKKSRDTVPLKEVKDRWEEDEVKELMGKKLAKESMVKGEER